MTRAQKLLFPTARLTCTCHVRLPPCLNYWPVLNHHYCSLPLLPPFLDTFTIDDCPKEPENLFLNLMREHSLCCFLECTLTLTQGAYLCAWAQGPLTPWFPDQARWHKEGGSFGDENIHPHSSCIDHCHQYFPPYNFYLRLRHLTLQTCSFTYPSHFIL